jgi:hypothetical protein
VNDRCSDALTIELDASGRGVARGTLEGTTGDVETCEVADAAAFHRVVLPERSVVAARVESENILVSLLPSCGEPAADCSATCGASWSGIYEMAVAEAGELFVMLSARAGTPETYRVDLVVTPIGDLPAEPLPPGTFEVRGEVGGSARADGCGLGPGRAFYFSPCGEGSTLQVATCGSAAPTAIEHRSGGGSMPAACSTSGTCDPGAELTVSVERLSISEVVIVRGRSATDTGTIVLSGSR